MNDKLTKEQAAWLIETLNYYNDGRDLLHIQKVDLQEIINQCTEKEFPELTVHLVNAGCSIEYVSIYSNKATENSCGCDIEMHAPTLYTHFTTEQFKQFTAGCQSICEWLEEQE